MDSKPLVDSTASASVEKKKAPTNTDSKAPVTVRDFDLNKFSDEETQPYHDEGLNQVVRLMLKAYLPKFLARCEFTIEYTTVFKKKKIQLFKILNEEINME